MPKNQFSPDSLKACNFFAAPDGVFFLHTPSNIYIHEWVRRETRPRRIIFIYMKRNSVLRGSRWNLSYSWKSGSEKISSLLGSSTDSESLLLKSRNLFPPSLRMCVRARARFAATFLYSIIYVYYLVRRERTGWKKNERRVLLYISLKIIYTLVQTYQCTVVVRWGNFPFERVVLLKAKHRKTNLK